MKLQNYTQRLDQGEDLSSEELAELFGLQVALNSYKSLLDVSKMDNTDFFNYFGLEMNPDSADTTDNGNSTSSDSGNTTMSLDEL